MPAQRIPTTPMIWTTKMGASKPLTAQARGALGSLLKDCNTAFAGYSPEEQAKPLEPLVDRTIQNPACWLVGQAAVALDTYCQGILVELLGQEESGESRWKLIKNRFRDSTNMAISMEEALSMLRARNAPTCGVLDALRLDFDIPWNPESRVIVALRDQFIHNEELVLLRPLKKIITEADIEPPGQQQDEEKFPWPADLGKAEKRPLRFPKDGILIYPRIGIWAACHVRDHILWMDDEIVKRFNLKTGSCNLWTCKARSNKKDPKNPSKAEKSNSDPAGDNREENGDSEIQDNSAGETDGQNAPPARPEFRAAMASITPFEVAKLALDLAIARSVGLPSKSPSKMLTSLGMPEGGKVRQHDLEEAYDLLEWATDFITERQADRPKTISFDDLIKKEKAKKRDRKSTEHNSIVKGMTSLKAVMMRLKTVFPTEEQRQLYPVWVTYCRSDLKRQNPCPYLDTGIGLLDEVLNDKYGRSIETQAEEDAFVELGITEAEEGKRMCLREPAKIRALEDILKSKELIVPYERNILYWACHGEGATKSSQWGEIPEEEKRLIRNRARFVLRKSKKGPVRIIIGPEVDDQAKAAAWVKAEQWEADNTDPCYPDEMLFQ